MIGTIGGVEIQCIRMKVWLARLRPWDSPMDMAL